MFSFAHVKFALRRWRRRPGFAVTAILTLALGVGSTTSIFSVIDAVVLRPLPWTEPERLVIIHAVYPDRRTNPSYATTWNRGTLTCPMWDALRKVSAFKGVAVWSRPPIDDTTFGDARTEIVSTQDVSSNLFSVLGAQVVQGRPFTAKEDLDASMLAIVPEEVWRGRFGARTEAVGATVMMGSASSGGRYPRAVVGVVESGFEFDGKRPDFYTNIGGYGETCRTYDNGSFRAIARLADDASLESAQVEAEGHIRALQRKEATTIRLTPLIDEQLGQAAKPLWMLFAGAGLLLLVACSNVAGLLLGDARARRQEIGVRIALGGGRARVVRQLFVEHSLLAVLGSAAGVVLAMSLTGAIVAIAPEGLPRIDTVAVDLRIAAMAMGLGCLTVIVFGVAPALSLARTPAVQVLAEGGRDGSSRRHIGHRLVVASQIAIAIVLLAGTALFGETIFRLSAQPLGFDPANLALVSTSFTGSDYPDRAAVMAARGQPNFRDILEQQRTIAGSNRSTQVVDRLLAIPGVTHVAASFAVPLFRSPSPVMLKTGSQANEQQRVLMQTVSDDYFATMGMAVLKGRSFNVSDHPGDVFAAVISRDLEKRFFEQGAVGRRMVVETGRTVTFEVIGVVPETRRRDLLSESEPMLYASNRQVPSRSPTYLVRTSLEASSLLPQIRKAIADVNPQIVVTDTTTMEDVIARLVAHERFRATLSGWFGGAALVLAAVGLYGLAARRVADRRREFAVRVALGAAPRNLRRLVMKDALVIVAGGLVAGLPAAFAASQVTQSFLFGVSATAPHVFGLAAGVLSLAAVLAMVGPARRASRLDPVHALKE